MKSPWSEGRKPAAPAQAGALPYLGPPACAIQFSFTSLFLFFPTAEGTLENRRDQPDFRTRIKLLHWEDLSTPQISNSQYSVLLVLKPASRLNDLPQVPDQQTVTAVTVTGSASLVLIRLC